MRAREDAGESWQAIVRDFHLGHLEHAGRAKYWGYKVLPSGHPDAKKPKTEEDLRAKEVRNFFILAVQSLFILKIIILFFGLNYAIEREEFYGGADTSFYAWGLGLSVLFSFGGLIWFAIRKSRGREWD
ncbi:MAG: hypothetical protein RBT63_08550 [Bdellovibrionales bacterium]|nr:hypothetical protein [Bdellovibrionales bacterium]